MLNNYNYFITLAEELNISRAAEKLFISHQCLSKYLKNLEIEYQTPLLERAPKLKLTLAGEALLETFRKVQFLEQNLQSQLEDIKNAKRGVIRLGTTEGRYRILMPKLLAQYHKLYPDVDLDVRYATSGDLAESIRKNELDVVLLNRTFVDENEFEVKPLIDEKLYLIVSDNMLARYFPDQYPECKDRFLKEGVDLADFQDFPFVLNTRKFKWDTSVNFSLSRNKLLEIGGEQQVITLGERDECYIAKVGDPLIQYYGYKVIGVWNTQEEINANPHFSQDVPGGVRIADTNGDGQLTADDRVVLGNPYPDFTWGITNTFKYKDFDFSFLIQGVQGITVYNGDAYYNESKRYNRAYTENRWVSPEHPGNGMTPYENKGYNLSLTDYPLENASYACLRNVTVGYTLPKTLTRKWNITSLRFYLTGSNLLYIWSGDYRGINPESRMTTNQYASAMISGYQRGGFPLTSTISAGFDINF